MWKGLKTEVFLAPLLPQRFWEVNWDIYLVIFVHVRNLGAKFESALTFDKPINSVVRSCFYQLKNIAKIKSFLTLRDMESVIHASHPD